jgi:hypothetical protein
MMSVMDHGGQKSLYNRKQLLERFLPDTYGTALLNKDVLMRQADLEVKVHGDIVQDDIDFARHQHQRAERFANIKERRMGKLNRIRGGCCSGWVGVSFTVSELFQASLVKCLGETQ